jgi:hypothetical protein
MRFQFPFQNAFEESSGKMTTNYLANFLELSEQLAANLTTQNDIHKFPRAIPTGD